MTVLSALYLPASAQNDPHSYSRPSETRVKHLDLDLKVDFERRELSGTAAWNLERTSSNRLVLDVRHMEIKSVKAGGKPLAFSLGESSPILGQALTIELPKSARRVVVEYVTKPEAAALQWLNPNQTAGGEEPFLFTQSQAILARTWIPCQDTPGVRFTYNARIQVPGRLLALMSASNPTKLDPTGRYEYEMSMPIPSYLMALAVGDVRFEPLGARTGIYAEPVTLKAAAHEFAETENMVEAVEKMYGPYRWERYDMLVLPPSFPFGGMENPRLTFLTPTVIAGDRSLTSLIAHELAHSWSGNLVTNANWNDFWLNEGFTVYLERRIMEELYGKDYAAMLQRLGYGDLEATLKDMEARDTHLKLDLKGRDPDEGLSDIAYEKGYLFLTDLERRVGREKFDRFLKRYFDDNAFGTVTTEGFLARVESELGANLGVEKWVYSAGIPEGFRPPVSERFKSVDQARLGFLSGHDAGDLSTTEWSTHEWIHFLRYLPESLPQAQLRALDDTFGFTNSGNSEILFQWLMLAVRNRYEPAYPALEEFLVTVGRRKFLEPLYGELARTEEGRARANDIYRKARPNYHSVTIGTIDEILKLEFRPSP